MKFIWASIHWAADVLRPNLVKSPSHEIGCIMIISLWNFAGISAICIFTTKRIGSIYRTAFELNLVKVDLYSKKWSGGNHNLSSTTYLQISEKHSFGVHTDKSPEICTRVEEVFVCKAGLLLNMDVTVPFWNVKLLLKTAFPFRVDAGVVTDSLAAHHYGDVIMSAMASQTTSLAIAYLTVDSGAGQRKQQSSASLAFVRGIHRWPMNSPQKVQ